MQTGQDVSAKTLPSPRDRINAELPAGASAALGCQERGSARGCPKPGKGNCHGKSCSASTTLKPKSSCDDGSRQNPSKN